MAPFTFKKSDTEGSDFCAEAPVHPGEVPREEILPELEITITQVTVLLGVSRETLSCVLNERAAISQSLAQRLELAGFGAARLWPNMQTAYELAALEREEGPEVRILKRI